MAKSFSWVARIFRNYLPLLLRNIIINVNIPKYLMTPFVTNLTLICEYIYKMCDVLQYKSISINNYLLITCLFCIIISLFHF